LIRDADREEKYAQLRSLPTNQTVQLPPQPGEDRSFVPAPKALMGDVANGATATNAANVNATNAVNSTGATNGATPTNVNVNLDATPAARPAVLNSATNNAATTSPTDAQTKLAPANAAEKTNVAPNPTAPAPNNASATTAAPVPNATPTVNAPSNNANTATTSQPAATSAQPVAASAPAESTAELMLLPEQQEMKVGERRRLMVFLKTDAPLGLATATLRFDPHTLAVRSVSQGVLTPDKSGAPVLTQSVDASGVLVVSVSPAAGAQPLTGEGLLLVIEVEALAQGDASLQFDTDKVHLIATDGRTVRPRFSAGKFKVTQ
jgi:hypothetical protein